MSKKRKRRRRPLAGPESFSLDYAEGRLSCTWDDEGTRLISFDFVRDDRTPLQAFTELVHDDEAWAAYLNAQRTSLPPDFEKWLERLDP